PEAAPLLAHELAHVRQYRRAGAAIFLGSYVGEYLGRRLAGAPHARAYRELSLERAAEKARRAIEKALEIGDRPAGSCTPEIPVRRDHRDRAGSYSAEKACSCSNGPFCGHGPVSSS